LTDLDCEKLLKALKEYDPTDWELYEYASELYDGVAVL